MSYKERLTILHTAEINDLYGVPKLSLEEKRISFALNDMEQDVIDSIRDRNHKCYAIALLGYFNIKPIPLNPSFKALKEDLVFIANEYFQNAKVPRFSVNRMQRSRIYDKIFGVVGFSPWVMDEHYELVIAHLQQVAQSCSEPRFLFDACIAYIAHSKIAIPKYTVIQRIISHVIKRERERIAQTLKGTLSKELAHYLAKLVDGNNVLTLKELKQAAKSFTAPELQKELKVNHMIQPWNHEVDRTVSALSLSFENQSHYASMVDYYSITKLKRFDRATHQLYLLCYLRERAQINIERIADGFVYHARKLREKATWFAKEMAYQDWDGAAANVSKAAELLHFFIDDTIDDDEPFSRIKTRANRVLGEREISSLCLYLTKQKRAKNDYIWEYYDQQQAHVQQLIRPLFLCLTFEGTHKTHDLASQLNAMQRDLSEHRQLRSVNQSLIPTKQHPML
jgi:hypothetical protein